MLKAEKAPATIKYAFAVVSQVWTLALKDKYVQGESPTKDKQTKLPTFDNQKKRYLKVEEVDKLLVSLRAVSSQVADMAELSLHSGLRSDEIFSLTWANIDFDRGSLLLFNTKSNGSFRDVPMTTTARNIFERRKAAENVAQLKAAKKGKVRNPLALVFPGRGGIKIERF